MGYLSKLILAYLNKGQNGRNTRVKVFVRTILFPLIGLCVLFFSSKPAFAATRTVCASSCDYTTIAAAEAGATSGDTVNVSTGTYNENTPTFNKALTWVAIDGNGTVIITNSGVGTYSAFITGSNISIQGFVFDALNSKAGTISVGAAATNNTLTSCTLRNPTTIHLALASANTGWTIANSTLSGNAGNTDITAAAAVSISGSSFTLPLRTSIALTHTSGTSQITNNTFTADGGTNQFGIIDLAASGTINITGNTFNLGQTTGLVSWPITDFVSGTGKTGTLNINGNTFNIYTSTTGSVIWIQKGQYAVTVGTPGNGNTFHLITSWPSSSVMVRVADQTTGPTISHNTVTSDYSGANLINWLRVYATSNSASYGGATISHNTLTMANPNGIGLLVGTDGPAAAGDHKIAPSTIEYNSCIAPGTSSSSFHCIEYGYQNNGIIRFNKSVGAGFGIVLKGAADAPNGGPTDFSTGTVNYNIISEPLGGSSGAGIHIKGINNVKLYNNTIYASRTSYAQNGIWAIVNESNNSTGWDFKNNIISVSNNASSIGINVESATQTGSQSNYNNIYKLGANGSIGKAGSTSYATLPLWQGGGSGYDANSISLDSLFVNAAGSDFSLQPTSPVINAGTNLGLTTDYAGNSVPQGSAPDIGAYEFLVPSSASSLTQYKSDGATVITSGGTTDESTVVLKLSMASNNTTDSLTPQLEVRPVGTNFTNVITHTGGSVAYSGSPVIGSANASSLSNGQYHWQARVSNPAGQSSWLSYGGNAESSADFIVNVPEPSPDPTPSPIPTPDPTPSPSSGENVASSYSAPSPAQAPTCTDVVPVGEPDFFQITRTKTATKLYFTPVNDNIERYHVIYGLREGNERFGSLSNPVSKEANNGVQSLTISELNPKSEYWFKVAPVNGCAVGTWSNWMKAGKWKNKNSFFYRYFGI